MIQLFIFQVLLGQPGNQLLEKGNKVYIEWMDDKSTEIANSQMQNWNHWKITQDQKEVDFILRFHIERIGRDCIGYAEYIDLKTNEVFDTSKEANSRWSLVWGVNDAKPVPVKKIIRKRIIGSGI